MRPLTLLFCVWSLWGCSSTGSPIDWILPDELTVGQGTAVMDGSASFEGTADKWGSKHGYDLMGEGDIEGETESTYAALTWKIPSYSQSDGIDRRTQRNMALLLDKMVADEGLAVVDDGSASGLSLAGLTLREGAPTPPPWMPYALGGLVLAFISMMVITSRRRNGW